MCFEVPYITGVTAIAEQVDGIGTVIVVAVAAVAAVAAIPAIGTTLILAKCTYRLLTASVMYNYYIDTGRAITQNNMHFQSILCGFF